MYLHVCVPKKDVELIERRRILVLVAQQKPLLDHTVLVVEGEEEGEGKHVRRTCVDNTHSTYHSVHTT